MIASFFGILALPARVAFGKTDVGSEAAINTVYLRDSSSAERRSESSGKHSALLNLMRPTGPRLIANFS